jgi:8-oxo-dGTP diphosphatase
VTLLFPLDLEHGRVLLGAKKTGFGQGKLVGIGGGIERDETPSQAAVRELLEETGLTVRPENLRSAGILEFLFSARSDWNMRVHLFTTKHWTGEPRESLELRPEWHIVDDLPWTRMWDDGPRWLPDVLHGAVIDAVCEYGADNQTVIRFSERDPT